MFGYALGLPVLFLLGSSLLSATFVSLRKIGQVRAKRLFRSFPKLFFLDRLFHKLHRKYTLEDLFFVLNFTKNTLLLAFAITGCFFILTGLFDADTHSPLSLLLISAAITMLTALIVDAIMRLISLTWPKAVLKIVFFPSALFALILLPLTSTLLWLTKTIFPSQETKETESPPKMAQDKILELVEDADLARYLDPIQRKLLTSISTFQERIVREIMVPRIDVTTLDIQSTVKEAIKAFTEEQYSRVPVYRENVDQICGVLLYKDLLETYVENGDLDQTIEPFIKPVIYAPETKKISKLLQEFRKEQSHLAIIVDEYGGTEGIVTIEDILEELVGEIEDEHDTDEETLFAQGENEDWVVDAKMSINDIETELNVFIPHSPEYDTLGGYVFTCAGSIPAKGWRIHHENFDLEVLSSSDRAIEKIRIIPH